jgi:YHS domain-containing protein
MKNMLIVILGLVLALAGTGFAAGSPARGQAQTVCPVQGGPINKALHADCQGERVYFCCPGCIGPFQKDPGKFLKKMEAQGVAPEKSPGGN